MKKTIGIIIVFVLLVIVSIFFGLDKGLFQNQFSLNNDSSLNKQTSYNPVQYTPTELASLLQKEKDKYVVIDGRTQLEYDKGHVPGAVHADYYDTKALKKAAGDKIPVTYDAFSSMRGIYAAYVLYQAGYKDVGILLGGLSAWAEDVQSLDSADPKVETVFNHPRQDEIFPERKKTEYPPNKGFVEFTIIAKKFSFIPDKIHVEHGQKVTLHIKSVDVIHGFSLPEFRIEEELLPNEQKDITFIADRKGNFPFVTNVLSGNRYSSMVGNLIVK